MRSIYRREKREERGVKRREFSVESIAWSVIEETGCWVV
jgi:hypothetical protein